jgi:membrane protein implicated in regulation of membrane protease activity
VTDFLNVRDFLAELPSLWLWLCLAGFFLVLELAAGSAFFLCLASAALITAGAAFILPDLPLSRTAVLFALLLIPASVCWRLLLRPRLKPARQNLLNARDKSLIGATATLAEDSNGLGGRLRVADASWPYVCDSPLKKGETVVVRGVQGIFLQVAPLPGRPLPPEEIPS